MAAHWGVVRGRCCPRRKPRILFRRTTSLQQEHFAQDHLGMSDMSNPMMHASVP